VCPLKVLKRFKLVSGLALPGVENQLQEQTILVFGTTPGSEGRWLEEALSVLVLITVLAAVLARAQAVQFIEELKLAGAGDDMLEGVGAHGAVLVPPFLAVAQRVVVDRGLCAPFRRKPCEQSRDCFFFGDVEVDGDWPLSLVDGGQETLPAIFNTELARPS
jgi:hypothetical protein